MRFQRRPERPACAHVPQPHGRVLRTAGQRAAVGAELDTRHDGAVTGERRAGRAAGAHVPQPHHPILAGAGHQRAVGAERDVEDRSDVSVERRSATAPVTHVPQPHLAVLGAGGEQAPVGADRHAADGDAVLERPADLADGAERRENRDDGAARFDGGLATVGLEADQCRQRDVVVGVRHGLRREVAGGGGTLLVACALDAADGEDRRDPGDDDEPDRSECEGALTAGTRGVQLALLDAAPASRKARSDWLRSAS